MAAAVSPAATATATYVPEGEQAGAVIAGRYKLLEEIGEGGMGTVWVAEQLEPIRRRVALKLVKPGMDSRAVLGRFEAERQALALMDHPNTAKVLDAGTTDDQRPYFVMELVNGTPITDFCDARRLSPRERLELFVPVCQAIQHAHTKGIIHRDIKPSNVLVALHDERPVPKVIDFGVAKAVGQQLTEKTLYTGFGALIGTPAYMAPEQATFNQLDIDTRADVYALGVLLYELLAGSPPVEPERLKQAALDEVLRIVREDEPPRPRQRLSTSHTKASIAAVRQSDPDKLTKLMRGEIDWIVMKALEKDRHRRYATADGFAADVQRYLAGEQVQAVPPSVAYRVRKFARKYRAALMTAAAFATLLLLSAAASVWLAVKARQAEVLAEVKRREAESNAKDAAEKSELYQKEAAAHLVARLDAEIASRSLQIDFDVATLQSDRRVGLLRLARPYKQVLQGIKTKSVWENGEDTDLTHVEWDDSQEQVKALREFVTLAVLAAGQDYAPLLPPITHDGHTIVRCLLSPDAGRILTLGEEHSARLWDTRTGQLVAVLRRGAEQVFHGGFGADGSTVFTDSLDGVVRLWDATDGQYRAETGPRPDRIQLGNETTFTYPNRGLTLLAESRLLTHSLTEEPRMDPVELWDAKTGQLIARLDRPEHILKNSQFRFAAGGRWIVAINDGGLAAPEDRDLPRTTVTILSSDDGRLLGRLTHALDENVAWVDVSPSGRRILSFAEGQGGLGRYRIWDGGTWRANPPTIDGKGRNVWARFHSDDLFIGIPGDQGGESLVMVIPPNGSKPRILSTSMPDWALFMGDRVLMGDRLHIGWGRLVDIQTGRQLTPPKGRKYHSDLRRFAPDGRLVLAPDPNAGFDWAGHLLIDTKTEKEIEFESHSIYSWSAIGHLSGFGWVAAALEPFGPSFQVTNVRLLPPARGDVAPELLELWAQVVVRGQLDDEGAFVQWDESTWEQKRQELAARPAPWPDFPYPGYVASDRLHWLRAEFTNATDEAEKATLAAALLKRAEAAGDNAEAVRWRAWLSAQAPQQEPPAE
jgi:WD40 repeat protein/tRNA A-37 threonylcarbamoyl transferase component Bud32